MTANVNAENQMLSTAALIPGLTVGDSYTKRELDTILGRTDISRVREGVKSFEGLDFVFFFVTLEKAQTLKTPYNDWFEGELFHWDSQTRQHAETDLIVSLFRGEKTPHLFVRLRENTSGGTEPWVYAGRLLYAFHDAHTARPVHVVWSSLDYMRYPTRALREVYLWSPAAGRPTTTRKPALPPPSSGGGQGMMAEGIQRRLIEQRAMLVADEWYRSNGYTVKDTSAFASWDLECTMLGAGRSLRVEVKGTTGGASQIFLTRNEVSSARDANVTTDLFIVYNIVVEYRASGYIARGGDVRHLRSWTPSEDDLEPVQFRYRVPAAS